MKEGRVLYPNPSESRPVASLSGRRFKSPITSTQLSKALLALSIGVLYATLFIQSRPAGAQVAVHSHLDWTTRVVKLARVLRTTLPVADEQIPLPVIVRTRSAAAGRMVE